MSQETPAPSLTIEDVRHRATLTVEQYARFMGVSRTTAYLAANDGTVTTVRVGRRILIPVPALLRSLGDA